MKAYPIYHQPRTFVRQILLPTQSRSGSRLSHVFTQISCWLLVLLALSGCQPLADHPEPQVTPFAQGLVAPLGLEIDPQGRLWVTEAGSGTANDGRLSMVTLQGEVVPVVTGFVSQVSPEGAVFGLNHLLLQGNILYLLHGVEGRLYQFDISTFKPGDQPRQASSLAYEEVGTFVKSHAFPRGDTDETDLFNLTVGPEGDLYLVDAAANAIIRRQAATGTLSVFASLPPVADSIQAVPTGIVFDGQKFLVSSFTGYPYPAQKAPIYQVALDGTTTVYQTGLSTLTDIVLDANRQPVVLEYGQWTGEEFVANSGKIVRSTPQGNSVLVQGLNFPNSIQRGGPNTYYVAQTFEGIIQKVHF